MSDFKILSERLHIKNRPSMYIGSTSQEELNGIIDFKYQSKVIIPGLIKIIEEIYQNAVDEAIRTNFEYGNEISVTIKEDWINGWYVEVSDNGRGIPVEIIEDKYRAELAWTRARAGSNFNDDDNRVTIGMNGIGSFATNCFSTLFIGNSCDGHKNVIVRCENGCETITTDVVKSKHRGTTVKFYPDLVAFSSKEISKDIIEVIRDRLNNLSICYPKIKFKFNDEFLVIKNSKQLALKFSEYALSFESDNYSIVINNSGSDEEFRHLSYFNGIAIKNGGNHIEYFIQNLCSELIPMIKRKYKIEVLPNQIKQHLICAFWVRNFPNPKFDSQSKERITNTQGEIKNFFNIDFSSIAKKLMNTEEIILPAIDAILRKKEAQEKRDATNALKKVQKKKILGHITANDKNPENKTIFIAEGDSAAGMGISVRNPLYHGFYSLRGKVLNTHGMSNSEILKNKELPELMTIIGLELDSDTIYDDPEELYEICIDDTMYIVGKNDCVNHNGIDYYLIVDYINENQSPIMKCKKLEVTNSILLKYKNQSNVIRKSGQSRLNYNKVVLLQDMDPDGHSIACLLIKFFSRWPDLFELDVIRRAVTPLYIANKKGKETRYFYTFEEYENAKSELNGWSVDYIKGLGSLEKVDYKKTIITEPRQIVIKLDDISKLDMAFGDSADDRKRWMID